MPKRVALSNLSDSDEQSNASKQNERSSRIPDSQRGGAVLSARRTLIRAVVDSGNPNPAPKGPEAWGHMFRL